MTHARHLLATSASTRTTAQTEPVMAKAAKDISKPNEGTSSSASSAKRQKQQFIPGAEPPSYPDLDELGTLYQEKKLTRMALLEEECDLKSKLQAAMHAHKLDYYPIPDTDLEITLEQSEETVKVKRRKPPKSAASETDFGDDE